MGILVIMSVPYLSPATLIMVFSGTSLTGEQARLTEYVNSPCDFSVHSLTSGNRQKLSYRILAGVIFPALKRDSS